MTTPSSRRAFLETIRGMGAATILGAVETTRGYAANDTIRVGCLGTGGRCRALMNSLRTIPGVTIAAVCDIWDRHLEEARALAAPKAFATKDFRAVLDSKDIDAVLIGSPDHWHVPMTVAACEAGKDVYVEKPLTHELAEGPKVIEAQDRHKRIVQVGTQQRSMPHLQKAKELVAAGRIGTVFKAHLTWNRAGGRNFRRVPMGVDPNQVDWKAFLGNAPDQPFDDFRFRNWRWFWDFGGGLLTDLMVHWIDTVHWILDIKQPLLATTIGNHFAAKDVWETPDTIQCLLSYPNDLQVYFEGTFSNRRNGAMCELMGTDATLYLDRGAYQLIPEPGKGPAEELVLGSNPQRGADFYDKPDGELLHLTNWIESVRTRKRPNCPAEEGVFAAAAAHLGNLAYRSGKVVRREEAESSGR